MTVGRTVPHIVAIGGGEIKDNETFPIDRHIVAATGRKRPRALFLPTASGDAAGYIETFHRVYGEQLGCRTEALTLLRNRPSPSAIRRAILGADLV
jgi:dipeptidase E